MKLIGSRAEQQMREELIRSNHALRDRTHNPRLINVLIAMNVNLDMAYVLNWIPEQAEDIYAVLITPTEVLVIEVPREQGEAQVERKSLEAYAAKCSKHHRMKITVAQDRFTTRNPHSP
ncbi:hypothetical protein ANRL3_02232 [Anaerolineae bacterium]|nr:hypothetical protein ANRL3_02232 [Anaerolineae bacterium]